jgi:Tfp pilus assembly protein PilX
MLHVANDQEGFILLFALIFLSIISFLVFTQTNDVIIHAKMASYQMQNAMAFNRAETVLNRAEQAASQSLQKSESYSCAIGTYEYYFASEDCNLKYFQIDAMGIFAHAQIHLRSKISVTKLKTCQDQSQSNTIKQIFWQQITN